MQFILAGLDFGGAQKYRKEGNAEPLPLEQVGAEVRDLDREAMWLRRLAAHSLWIYSARASQICSYSSTMPPKKSSARW